MLRRTVAALTLCTLTSIAAVVAVSPAHRAYADTPVAGNFVPLNTGILLDTRSGVGAAAGVRAAGSTTVFPVRGVGGVSTDASAVLVTLITVNPAGANYLAAWPDGSTRPSPMSMANGDASKVTSNMAVIPIGANGKIDVYTNNASHIVVEAEGYFTTTAGTTGAGGFVPVTQTRLVDTRSGIGAPKATIQANGGTLTVTVGTGAPIPATAGSALLNVTVLSSGTAGWVGLYPGGTTTGNSVLNYDAGATASSAAVKLNAGTVTVVNHGSAAINVLLDAEGYFTTQPSDGAALHPMTAVRVLDTGTATIAAGATYDLQIGGTHGLPTRGIAGALLNLTVVSAAVGGYVTAWPVGETEPTVSLTQYPAGAARADAVSVRVGTEGKVHIRNRSSGTIRLLVDLQGWFAGPLPTVPVARFSSMVGIQGQPAAGAQVGALELSYVDNAGQLHVGYQPDPANTQSVQWSTLLDSRFTGPPTLGAQPDGGVQLAAQSSDSNIWSALRPASLAAFGPWAHDGGSMASTPVLGRQPDGGLVVFAVDADGELWDLPQSAANGTFSAWHPLGAAGLTDSLTTVTVAAGIEVFGLDTTGALRAATLSSTGALSPWTNVGGTGLNGRPAVALYPGFQPRVFIRGSDGVIVTKMQSDNGTWPADFAQLGSLVAAGSPAAVFSPISGKAEVVIRTADGAIYNTGETAQASGQWRDWASVLVSGDVAASDPTTLIYNAGTGLVWAFMFQNDLNQGRLYTTTPTAFARKAIPEAR
jgi:hypothetical protein